MEDKIKVNELEFKTFNYLKVNEKTIEDEKLKSAFNYLGKDFGTELVVRDKSEVKENYHEMNGWTINRDNFTFVEGKPVSFGIYFNGEKDQAHNLRLTLRDNSKAKIFLIYNMYDKDFIGNFDIEIGENAELEFAPLFLLGHRAILDLQIHLRGEGSKIHMEGGYVVGKNSDMDINMYCKHNHKDTNSLLNMHGILLDGASKTYKYTIDFPRGSSGSKGIESEKTIALTDNFKNTVVPVLLVGEDMIEAEHGATLTEPDDDKLDYIYSRGIQKDLAEYMVVEAELSGTTDMFSEKGKEIAFERLEEIFLGDDYGI